MQERVPGAFLGISEERPAIIRSIAVADVRRRTVHSHKRTPEHPRHASASVFPELTVFLMAEELP